MTEIKRYEMDCDDPLFIDIRKVQSKDGEFVTYDDHAAIVAALQERIVFKENMTAEIVVLQEQVRALAAQWVFVSESGNPSVPAGERAEFWVCHADKDGQHSVTKLTWFNHVEPHEDDQDAIDCCEMSTPDGESFWPFGWHEEFSSHDFDHFYEPSRLKVVAYAPFTAPGVPLSIHAGEQP